MKFTTDKIQNALRVFGFTLVCLFALASCTAESSKVLESTSENGRLHVSLVGERYSDLDPWKVSVTYSVDEVKREPVVFEVQATTLDESTVTFDWKNNQQLNLVFLLPDGEEQIVPVTVEYE